MFFGDDTVFPFYRSVCYWKFDFKSAVLQKYCEKSVFTVFFIVLGRFKRSIPSSCPRSEKTLFKRTSQHGISKNQLPIFIEAPCQNFQERKSDLGLHIKHYIFLETLG